jgi:hypothetical protein
MIDISSPGVWDVEFETELQKVQATFGKRTFTRVRPESEYPELQIVLPDALDTIELAPWYDVHIGSPELDESLLDRHLAWMERTSNVFSWLGGDIIENKTPNEGKMGRDAEGPEEQILSATKKLAPVQHKLLFSIPGNHEDRTFKQAGMLASKRLADNLQIPYFSDYALVTFSWRGNKFRLMAHHGTGAAQTPGGQRNAARKELVWFHPDMLWTGHIHQALTDPVKVFCFDQASDRIYEKDILVLISPSYLKFFGGYAAHARYGPGLRGLSVVILNDDGRMDASVHARGKRL